MRRLMICCVGLAAALASSAAWAGPFPDRRVLMPYQSVATAGELWALRYNPAALAVDDDLELLFAHTYSDSAMAGNDLLYLGKHGIGLGVEWLGSGGELRARHHTIGWGGEVKDRVFFGASYRWVTSDDARENKAHFWSAGLMVRPGTHLSLGMRVDNLNHMPYQGARTDAIYTYSAGLNFADGRFVLGVDYDQGTDQRLADGAYRFGAAVELIDGLILYGDYGNPPQPLYDAVGSAHRFGLGVRLNLREFMVSSYNAFNRGGRFFRGNFAVGSFQHHRRTVIPGRREIADLRLSGHLPEREPPRFFFLPDPPPRPRSSGRWIA